MFEKFKELIGGGGSWVMSVIGFIAGVSTYLAALGPNLPTTGAEWGSTLVSASLVALGYKAK